jgi:hypothetical protein
MAYPMHYDDDDNDDDDDGIRIIIDTGEKCS